jgi:alpha-ribazole phosphatase
VVALDVYVIRHTRVAVESGVCYGQTDVSLAASFEAECVEVQEKLPTSPKILVWSSPLQRCRTLAEHLATGKIQLDARLMEMDFGSWEQQRWDEIDDVRLKEWMADFVDQPCSGGESFQDLYQRVVAFWHDFVSKTTTDALIVTHGGVIRALLAYLLAIPLKHVMRLSVDFGSVTKICVYEYGPVIKFINR